jgi:hypothetical protein
MKKFSFIIIGIAISLMLISCQSNSVSPVEGTASDLTLSKPLSGNSGSKIVAKVTGSGHYYFAEDDWRTFSFNARAYADGTFEGNYTRTHHFQGESQHAKGIITYFEVVGNEAWIAGEDTQGSNYEPEFRGSVFHAVDNGEGANDPPDQISAQYVSITPEEAIDWAINRITPQLNDVVAGNIQVH